MTYAEKPCNKRRPLVEIKQLIARVVDLANADNLNVQAIADEAGISLKYAHALLTRAGFSNMRVTAAERALVMRHRPIAVSAEERALILAHRAGSTTKGGK